MPRIEDMLQKMMRRFDASDEHAKELRGELANIGQKVDAHSISIKHLELQMAELCSTMNPHQSVTPPRNTVQSPKNNGHCMVVTTTWGKQTMDPPMSSGMEDEVRKEDELVEDNGELADKTVKKVEITQNVIPVPRPPPLIPQILVKKTENVKYLCFITMLK